MATNNIIQPRVNAINTGDPNTFSLNISFDIPAGGVGRLSWTLNGITYVDEGDFHANYAVTIGMNEGRWPRMVLISSGAETAAKKK